MNKKLEDYKLFLDKFRIEVEKKYGEYCGFAYDGPINSSKWFSNSPDKKILFLLKEAYGYDGHEVCDIMDRPDRFRDSKTNRAVAKLIFRLSKAIKGILLKRGHLSDEKLFEQLDIIYDSSTAVEHNNLKSSFADISIVELKKVSGHSKSNDLEIREHSKEFAGLLSEQIKLLTPDIIICGGQVVWDALTQDINLFEKNLFKSNEKGIYKANNMTIINSYHPSSSKFSDYDIMFDICRNESN